MIITQYEAIADEDKYIHRIGDTMYFKRCTLLPDETKESFAEITIEEYNKIQEEEQAKYNLM